MGPGQPGPRRARQSTAWWRRLGRARQRANAGPGVGLGHQWHPVHWPGRRRGHPVRCLAEAPQTEAFRATVGLAPQPASLRVEVRQVGSWQLSESPDLPRWAAPPVGDQYITRAQNGSPTPPASLPRCRTLPAVGAIPGRGSWTRFVGTSRRGAAALIGQFRRWGELPHRFRARPRAGRQDRSRPACAVSGHPRTRSGWAPPRLGHRALPRGQTARMR